LTVESDLLAAPFLEAAMNTFGKADNGRQRMPTNRLHSSVYGILIVLVAWFALAVWNFAGGGITDYLLFIVCGFVFVAVMLPLILSRVGRDDGAAQHQAKEPSLRDWVTSDYETWTGKLSGTEAAMQILLPIAAAAAGMTLIGIIFRIAEHSAA
jgi:hypothetical protein